MAGDQRRGETRLRPAEDVGVQRVADHQHARRINGLCPSEGQIEDVGEGLAAEMHHRAGRIDQTMREPAGFERKTILPRGDEIGVADEDGPGLAFQTGLQQGLPRLCPPIRPDEEETFGPVIPLLSFGSEDEVVERSNQTSYGLAAYLYTSDLGRATRTAERLEFGIVGVNDAMPASPTAPFGGFKESGLGREGGRDGLSAFMETKLISVAI